MSLPNSSKPSQYRFKLSPNKFSRVQNKGSGVDQAAKQHVAEIAAVRNGHAARHVLKAATPTPRPDPKTRFQLSPRPMRMRNAQVGGSKSTETAASAAIQPHLEPTGPLHALSVDDFLQLCAFYTSDRIATAYDVQVYTVHARLSKAIRIKASEREMTIEQAKEELNLVRKANDAIPVIDGRYGVRSLPSKDNGTGHVSSGLHKPISHPGMEDCVGVGMRVGAPHPWESEPKFEYYDLLQGEV